MTKIRTFLASDLFNVIMLILACVIITVDQMIATPAYYGLAVFYGFIIAVVLMLTDDIISIFCPVLLLVSFVIQYKNSYDGFMKYLWGAPIIAFAIIFHFVYYRKSFKRVKLSELALFKPMCFATLALLMGGIGIMTFAEYTTKISLSYMFCLGPLIILIYVLLSGFINDVEGLDERLAKIFITVACFLIFAIFEYYGENWSKFISDPNILPFQWRNNASTILMLAMPFSFFMAKKKNFLYVLVALLSVVALVLSGSRGGLLFGLIEFLILIIYYCVTDAPHRKYYLAIIGIGIVGALVLVLKYASLFSYTIDRFTSHKENFRRLGLWQRSLVDFKANPLFGRGIGYMGNRDLHPSAIGQLCWYHSSIPQVIGSFGIMGILCYGYQLICRLKFFKARDNMLSKTVFFSFLGLELMSLVNPGIFAPAYLVIITMLFVFVEQFSKAE
ncbi:MAG: O-antigen ligase family protein [Oscillospiraceae bacterium]|nr:O-antigen ligase family protein [Candidatus Limimonas coprohippi]